LDIDKESFFRTKIDNMLVKASWVDALKAMTGLDGVSQVWSHKPEWYIWIQGAPGVYGLSLEETDTIRASGKSFHAGRFAMKCYPYRHHPCFMTFSPEERRALSGDLFDPTHTPRLEDRDRIPSALFTVGSLTLLMDADETGALFTFDILDALRISQTHHGEVNKTGDGRDASDGRVVRNVPGFRIGYPLFDRLVSLYAFYGRRRPQFIGVTRSPGFEHRMDAAGNTICRQSADTRHWAVSLLISSLDPLVDTLWRDRLEGEEEVVFFRRRPRSTDPGLKADIGIDIAFNPLWWELAETDLKSELGSTCGCGAHGHHACMIGGRYQPDSTP
jgi:hypothetical protein